MDAEIMAGNRSGGYFPASFIDRSSYRSMANDGLS
jgi:hypothetical protein